MSLYPKQIKLLKRLKNDAWKASEWNELPREIREECRVLAGVLSSLLGETKEVSDQHQAEIDEEVAWLTEQQERSFLMPDDAEWDTDLRL